MPYPPTPEQKKLAKFLEYANHIADDARDIARDLHLKSRVKWTKDDGTWITEADVKIEETAYELIRQLFPNHDFYGEEYGDNHSNSEYKWCVDPIDGTMAYVYGLPTFTVLIALTQNNEPILGIIESPSMGYRWCGAKTFPTTWQGHYCSTNSDGDSLASTAVFATSIDMFSDDELQIFNRVSHRAKERRFGADSYAYGMLAAGFIDVIMEADMKPYDLMALVPVIQGAGGIITDWDGAPLTLNSGRQVLATASQKLHDECLTLIHGG